ncbi:ABC transporter permease [Anaerotignum propionicum]|jgi:simple sugar transport system permease protein|uniref:Beta-methylgalactoside transporter inner membrane component n=1 Tax=Anaerotignum propionicum DSM 1682 TaxID=991789 RepID=A0A0X1U869_ANAPI|nr:ABC transporter permease [Anaerotignum propionicum]AMJ41137.1 beta-methylgalactoside transporter inner membrane component [Anaerotignum propionicum DSM 1682]MEA5057659.1 ABC transporter permease [Anaerotignum propionicum]SHE64406.1 nucleoside ABC transporter membrane protein [[Clostridium] propionicum DSM 1682] [Anaerotignum propionicum DSM 1682]
MFEQLINMVFSASFGYSIIRITSPILFAALAAVVAEKGGVVNIGLEGIMMISALFGVLFSYWTNSWLIGVLGAVAIGVFVAMIMAIFALKLKTDIILSGIAVNLLGGGGTVFLLYLFTGLKGNTASLTTPKMLTPKVHIPILKDIPIIGQIFSGHSVLTYVAFLLVFLVWILLYKTAMGLRIRAVGENSHAADSVGVSVLRTQYIALAISGALAGLGGAYMSMYYSQSWNIGIVAGRGFIALAAQAMGQGEPVGAMLASLLFGFASALGSKMEGMQGFSSYLVASIPYAVTIIGLVIYALSTLKRVKRFRDKAK